MTHYELTKKNFSAQKSSARAQNNFELELELSSRSKKF
jgi:hypothetical protein